MPRTKEKKIKTKKQKTKLPSIFDYINMESKLARWIVRISIAFFTIFGITAFMQTLQNANHYWLWWVLTALSGCTAAGVIVFCSDFLKN